MNLSILKNLDNQIFANNSNVLKIVAHPIVSDLQTYHKGTLKVDALGLINAFYGSNFFEIDFKNAIKTHTLKFQKQTFPRYTKDIFGMANAKANAKILFQEFINCLNASFLGEQYHITGTATFGGNLFYVQFEAKFAGANYNLEIKAYDDNSKLNNIWNGTTTASWYNIVDEAVNAPIYNHKVWVKILCTYNGKKWDEIYKNYSNVAEQKSDKWIYQFEGIPFIMKSFLSFANFSDPYSLVRASVQSTQFKIQYYSEYNSNIDYINEDLVDIKEIINAGVGYFEPQNSIDDKCLNTRDYNIISPNQPAWFSIFKKTIGNNALKVRYISKENTTLATINIPDSGADELKDIVHIPVWLANANAWLDTESLFQVQILINNVVRYTYFIDYTYFPNAKWIYFFNSMGGVDAAKLQLGKGESYSLSFYEYQSTDLARQTASWRTTFGVKNQANTDNVDEYLSKLYKELIRSTSIYEVDADTVNFPTLPMPRLNTTGDMPYRMERYGQYEMISHPIIITTKDVVFTEKNNNLFSVKIDYVRANEAVSVQQAKPIMKLLRNDFVEMIFGDVFSIKQARILLKGINIRVFINGKLATPIQSTGIDSVWGDKMQLFDILPYSNTTQIAMQVEGHLISHFEVKYEGPILVLDSHFESIRSIMLTGDNEKNSLSHLIQKYGYQNGLNLSVPNIKRINMDDCFMEMLHFLNKNATVDVRNTPAIGLSGHAQDLAGHLALTSNIIIQND